MDAKKASSVSSNKCNNLNCNKKLKLTDFPCRCELRFCITHKLPESHECLFDYKTEGCKQLSKQLQSCIAKKLINI